MKKRYWLVVVAAVLLLAALGWLVGTGFIEQHQAVLTDFALSEDGSRITMEISVMSSMGYVRGYRDMGGGVKPHYLVFYSTFGGLNSRLGAKNTFVLELGKDDREIWFNRAGGGYELVLIRDEATGTWQRP